MGINMINDQKLISVNPRYKTSTRIDGTDKCKSFIDDFIVHGTAISTLETLCKTYTESSQRTFTITGPYGSGKSTLALFFSYMLSSDKRIRDYASDKVKKFDGLVEASSELSSKSGWKAIKHVCGLTSPAQGLLLSLSKNLGNSIDEEALKNYSDDDCLRVIKEIINKKGQKADGLLILIDEMGKALDFQSRTGGDLYFFQELADIAQQSKNNVMIIGFLHQAFVEYAKGKDVMSQKEWAKVQGRYIDFGFNPSIDESLVLVGDSILKDSKVSVELEKPNYSLVNIVTQSFKAQGNNKTILLKTLPLDPVVSLLLGPISRRRFSQNERSLFGFLASNERYGFREFLNKNYIGQMAADTPLYQPEVLWDYLDHNLHHVIVTSNDGKGWLEACDAIQRASQKGSPLHVIITKLVALLTVFGFHNHLHATREFVINYLSCRTWSETQVSEALQELESWTVLIFRQKHNALFIFQGSDIDINSLLLETIESLSSGVDWTAACKLNLPVLATSHYHKTGTMRWANTQLVDRIDGIAPEVLDNKQLSGTAFLTFVLSARKSDVTKLKSTSKESSSIVIGQSKSIETIKTNAIELLALEHIKKTERQITHDLIAKKELETRIDESKRGLEARLISAYENAQWYYAGIKLDKASLSATCSDIAKRVYPKTPIMLNELVNRSKPSGSANAGINKVMIAMLENGAKEDLGFDINSFPPEKGIYLSCIKSKGWHQKTKEGFMFAPEWDAKSKAKNPDMYDLWQSGVDFIKNNKSMVTIDKLYAHWMSPPFGLTSGLCRIYGLALLKSLDGQVAYYDNDSTNNSIFIPELDEVFVNKLHKHPHEAGVRHFEISSIQHHLVSKIAEATNSYSVNDSSILEIAKHLVKIVHTLKPWVKKTSGDSFIDKSKPGLTTEARAFRNEVLRANDPYKLILESLPSIFDVNINSEGSKEVLSHKLRTALDDLTSQHEMLVFGFKQTIKDLLGAELNSELFSRCENVKAASQRPRVTQFADRLGKFINNSVDFEMVIVTAAGAPERNWTDNHIRNALDEIQNLCVQFRRIESFSKLSDETASRPMSVMTRNELGEDEEYEVYLKTGIENDADVLNAVDVIESLISSIPIEKQKAALSKLLLSRMDKAKEIEIAN